MSYIRTAGFALVVALAMGGVAHAQDRQNIEKAKSYFYAGEQAYKIGQYRAAIQAYEEAYRLYPVPAFLFNTAQAHRKQYDLDSDIAQLKLAKDLYERFLREDPTSPRKAQAQQLLDEVNSLIRDWKPPRVSAPAPVAPPKPDTQAIVTSTPAGAEVVIDTQDFSLGGHTPYIRKVEPGHHTAWVRADGFEPAQVEFDAEEGKLVAAQAILKEIPALLSVGGNLAGADVTIDGIPVGTTPLPPRMFQSGSHTVVVTARGHKPWARTVDLPRGGKLDLEARMEITNRRRAAWIGLAGAGVLAVAGTVMGALAISAANDVDALKRQADPQHGLSVGPQLDNYQSLADSANHRALAADILLGCAAAAAGTSAYLFWFDRPTAEGGPAPGGVGIVVQHKF